MGNLGIKHVVNGAGRHVGVMVIVMAVVMA